MVRAIPVLKSPAPKKAKTDDTTYANPVKRGPGRPPKDVVAADGSNAPQAGEAVAVATGGFLAFPPPPPPPPPPADNPYYQKFVEQYWQKYDGSYSSLPAMPVMMPPVAMPVLPPSKAKQNTSATKKHREYAAQLQQELPPITLAEEFPINTDRTTYFLGDPAADSNVLSEKSCYIRTRLVEIFVNLPSDDVKGNKDSKTAIGRVGLRCVYCASLPHKARGERSVSYPSSLSRLYHTVADMQHKHLEQCTCIPLKVKQVINQLSSSSSRGDRAIAPKTYWEVSAKKLGIVEVDGEGSGRPGLRLKDGHKLIEKSAEVVDKLFVAMGEGKKKANDVTEQKEEEEENEVVVEIQNEDEEEQVENMDEEQDENQEEEQVENMDGDNDENEEEEQVEEEEQDENEAETSEKKIENADNEVEEILANL